MSTCSEYSHDGRMTWQCHRPVKAEGMCAQHLAGKRRREAGDLARAERYRRESEAREAVEAQCARLAELGIQAVPEFSSIKFAYTGRVAVDPTALIAWLVGA